MFQVNLSASCTSPRPCCRGCSSAGSGKVVNNASISGYAYFPAATTYAASKAGVVAFTESLRRELKDTGVSTLHLVTPGRATPTCSTPPRRSTAATSTPRTGRSSSRRSGRPRWSTAIRDDRTVLGPGGKTAIAKLASRGPASCSTGSRTGCSAASRGSYGRRRVALAPLAAWPAPSARRRSGARGSPPRRRPGRGPTCAGTAGRSPAPPPARRWPGTPRASARSVSA